MILYTLNMRYFRIIPHSHFLKLSTKASLERQQIKILDGTYSCDDFTNVTPKIVSFVGRKLHNCQFNPLCLTKQKIVDYFNINFKKANGNALFPIFDDLNPVVTVYQNFDSLLIPKDHVSRNKSECYYLNRNELLRAHMTSHQSELIKMGLDRFLAFGDVYRRDEIDSTHFPVFHQLDAAQLYNKHQLDSKNKTDVRIFQIKESKDSSSRQGCHSEEATKIVEEELKSTLTGLMKALFSESITCRWVDVYFPFTHPSWELEIYYDGKWIEVLGCGVMRNEILQCGGAEDSIGWAFGIGLERLAMMLYSIPDIRLFWSRDSGFLNQFKDKTPYDTVVYKPVSIYPQCTNDISFWLPDDDSFVPNDFYELVRDIGENIIEQVHLIDDFTHPKTSRRSLCYRIVYRHLERTLTQDEVNRVHKEIEETAMKKFKIIVR